MIAVGFSGIGLTYSQSLSPQVIASSGTTFTSASSQLEFTIGEPLTATLTSGGNTVTQGFHQPNIQVSSIENNNSEYSFTLYPNPAEEFVTVESNKEKDMQVHVFDANGKAILISNVFQQKITIDLQTLAAGTYLLRITTKDGLPLHSYRVIKK